MPSGAGDPLTPARQGQVIDIQCQTDSEYDTCIFTHSKPFDVGQSSYNEDRVSDAWDDDYTFNDDIPAEHQVQHESGLRIQLTVSR